MSTTGFILVPHDDRLNKKTLSVFSNMYSRTKRQGVLVAKVRKTLKATGVKKWKERHYAPNELEGYSNREMVLFEW